MPYTAAAPSAPTRPRATKNTRPYIADCTPVSRTPAALVANVSTSRRCRPNNLTSSAPLTFRRSLICVFIWALSSMLRREMPCSRRPTRLAGMMKIGSTTNDNSVRRHSNATIAPRVAIRVTMLLTTLPSVLVNADWAPITSLFIRLMTAPVWVRVKKAIGIRCTLSNNATRKS